MLKLQDVISKLKDTYRSIELCVACVYYEEKWINLLTVIRFSSDEIDVVNKVIQKNPKLRDLQNGNKVRLFRISMTFTCFEELVRNLRTGFITIGETTIHFEPMKITEFDMILNRASSYYADRWGYFYIQNDRKNIPPYNQADFYNSFRQELIPYSSGDIYQLTKEYFDIYEYNSNRNLDFVITAPIYARIKNIELEGKKIKVTVLHHKKLNTMYLHYERKRQYQSEKSLYNNTYTFNGDPNFKSDFMDEEVIAEELDLVGRSHENVTCEANLFIESIPDTVSEFIRHLTEMFHDKKMLDMNPLAMAFVKFCSIEKLTELLLKPTEGGKDNFKLSDSDNFERMVQWLFSLQGFQSIWLGKDFETLLVGKNRQYSADLLCYSEKEKTLAIVSCKTSVPKTNDIDLIKNLADRLNTDFMDSGIKIIPIIVSSEPCDAVKQNISKLDVDVIDANDIKNILSAIHKNSPNPRFLLRKKENNGRIGLGHVNYDPF